MFRGYATLSGLFLAGALVAAPALAQDTTEVIVIPAEPSVQMDQQNSFTSEDMNQEMDSEDSTEVASTYCYVGSVFDQSTGESVDLYSLCQADSFDSA